VTTHLLMGIAWFKAEQWNQLRSISIDKENIDETYSQWLKTTRKSLSKRRLQGMHVHKVLIDVDELQAWCADEKCPIDADARIRFTQSKLQELHDECDCGCGCDCHE
jgi:hypothetical protein